MQEETRIVAGSSVVLREEMACSGLNLIQSGEIYRVEEVEVVPLETLLPPEYISSGYIPDQYKPHMIKGIGTTNHDTMGSDRFVTIRGEKYSVAWFRHSTATEVNRKARSNL